MLENQDDKGSLQKAPWRSSNWCRKVWWLDNGRSQSHQWCEKRDNHQCAVVVQDLATQWILSYPCKTNETRKNVKNLGAVAHTESCTNRQLDGILESMWRFIMESPHFNTSSIRDKWHCWKSRSTSKRRYFSSIATVRTRWKVVVWLHGMLLLSAKCPRPPGRRENSVWKTICRTIQRANNTIWSIGWTLPYFTARFIKNTSIWKESITWNIPLTRNVRGRYLAMRHFGARRGENLERRHSDCGLGRFGKVGRIRNSFSKNQRERSMDQTKRWWIHISHLKMVPQDCQEDTTNSQNPL